MNLPHQDNELRKKLKLSIKLVDADVWTLISLAGLEGRYVDAILDIIISELPKKRPFTDGYNAALRDITAILTAAKEAK